MTESSGGGAARDVVDVLSADHREMLALLGEIEHTADAGRRRDLADTVIAEVMRHAVAEEMYVYPAIEEHVPDGPAHVAHDKAEHEEIVLIMKQLEDADASDPAFLDQVRRLEAGLLHHASHEESEQFPYLRAHIPGERLVKIGEQVQFAKKLAPTRPHPSAPHSELFHKTLGPGVGLIDRLRDKLTGRHTG